MTAVELTVYVRYLEVDQIRTLDYGITRSGTDLVDVDLTDEVRLAGPLDRLLAVVARVQEQLTAVQAARAEAVGS